jgi:hypothetical protein
MAHPLDGARLKIVWADKHLRRFKLMARCYKKGKLNRFVFEKTNKSFKASLLERAKPDPPAAMQCIVGDCVTNARAALDYITWEIASRYFVPAIDLKNRQDRQITAFPLFDDPAAEGLAHRLKGLTNRLNGGANSQIPARIVKAIEAAQPYHSGYEPLWLLHEVVNSDKHRLPPLMAARIKATGPMSLTATSEGRQDVVVGVGVQDSLQMDTSHIFGKFKMQVDSNATIFIAFSDASMPTDPVDRLLEDIIKCVAKVIAEFDSFL